MPRRPTLRAGTPSLMRSWPTPRTACTPPGVGSAHRTTPHRRVAAVARDPRSAICDRPRTLATLAAIHDELMDDLFVYRFRQDARPLGDAEGAFVLCGFLLALSRTLAPLPRTCRYNRPARTGRVCSSTAVPSTDLGG